MLSACLADCNKNKPEVIADKKIQHERLKTEYSPIVQKINMKATVHEKTLNTNLFSIKSKNKISITKAQVAMKQKTNQLPTGREPKSN